MTVELCLNTQNHKTSIYFKFWVKKETLEDNHCTDHNIRHSCLENIIAEVFRTKSSQIVLMISVTRWLDSFFNFLVKKKFFYYN